MYDSDLITRLQSERFFFDNSTIHQDISTRHETMKKITSILVVLGEIDIDSVSAVAFIGDDVRFLGHGCILIQNYLH